MLIRLSTLLLVRRRLPLLALVTALTACGAEKPEIARPQPVAPATTASAPARPAAAAPKPDRHPSVVMLVFDQFSYGALLDSAMRIDPVLYPHLSALSKQSNVYSAYTSPSDETTSLFTSMLTSRRYDAHAKPRYAEHPRNLFTSFARGGYRLKVRESDTALCPPRICAGNRPPQSAHDVLRQLASGRIQRFRNWVGLMTPQKRPTLWWTHLMLPHGPLQYGPSGRRYNPFPTEEIPGLNDWPSFGDAWFVRQAWQR